MAVINSHALNLELDSAQYLSRADEALLSITGNLTIECWVNFESIGPARNSIVSKNKQANGARSWCFFFSGPNELAFTTSDNGTTEYDKRVTWTPTTGVWYHVAVVYTAAAGTVDFYVNGAQQGAQQTGVGTSQLDNDQLFLIGATVNSAGNPDQFFDGQIDDVRLWSTTRTEAQILANMRTEIDSATNLVGSWHLNNVLTDSSGNALTLTNNGTATFVTAVPWFEITDTAGTDTESVVFEHTIDESDTSGTPTETITNKYGWGNLSKSSTTWTNQTKS